MNENSFPGQSPYIHMPGETLCFFFLFIYLFLSFFKKNKFIYLFLAAFGLRCCALAFSGCGEWGLLFVSVSGLVAKHGL